VGNCRFIGKYLKTGEALYQDLSIIEGANPPLTFEFSPATFNLRIESTPVSVPVKVNDQPIGYTPQTVTVDEGKHIISVPQEVET
jgi:hypothetical protein